MHSVKITDTLNRSKHTGKQYASTDESKTREIHQTGAAIVPMLNAVCPAVAARGRRSESVDRKRTELKYF
jgi:hypothetical protein